MLNHKNKPRQSQNKTQNQNKKSFETHKQKNKQNIILFVGNVGTKEPPGSRKDTTSKGCKRAELSSSIAELDSNSKTFIHYLFENFRAFIFILEHHFSLDVWDPFKDFTFPSSLVTRSPETSAFVNTRIDWKETPEAHVFKADLPGLKKEEVKVEVEDDMVLQISGERKIEKEDKNDTWHHVELSSGKISRRFRLPENVKMDQVKASMENGFLLLLFLRWK
ncbi:17.5 kDa class I heat shock protein [Hibiscus syriacus]|uniref:17.5 kDa class I heat shock protein n=1 Tax=Hibiscus syriacus TaxID=106335 RepID=A0A6A3AQS4_HIBSY|nr:17.5 kDa class I heat shock protein [Hibiscus syriacus]